MDVVSLLQRSKNIIFTLLYCSLALVQCQADKDNLLNGKSRSGKSLHTDVSSDYSWNYLPIGGGGYVTGIAVHPQETDIRYIRTDVGGAYRWHDGEEGWIQLLGWVGPDNENLIGVDGVALDPSNPDRVYLALGRDIDKEGGVWRSEDRGTTWALLMSAHYEGNGREARWTGEPIAVDPHAGNIIYAGTRMDGLWRSSNDGVSWTRITDVPRGHTGTNPTGVRSVVFDPGSYHGGKSSTLYVAVPGHGIYTSSDGGETFSHMDGSPETPARLKVAGGELFVTHSSGVAHWSGAAWSNLTPSAGNYVGLSVDETNNNRLVVAERYRSFFNPIYRSEDKGGSWQEINTPEVPAELNVHIPWWNSRRFSSATAGMEMIPGSSGELLYTDWFGVWYTPDVWASQTEWHTLVKGHEETVVLTLVASPEGPLLYSGMADNFGFRHDNLDEYPEKRLYPLNEGFSIALSEHHPSNIAILGARGWGGEQTRLATSADFGETWTERTLPEGSTLGKIAISSGDPDKMIYVAGGGAVYYSGDRGDSWSLSQGAPKNAIRSNSIWNKDFALAADLVNEDRFYLFKDGVFYASDDSGATWSPQNEDLLPNRAGYLNVIAIPDKEGEVWISLDENGLWRTTDSGMTFTQIDTLDSAALVTFGAPAPELDSSTIYVYGKIDGAEGLYRSRDQGETWVRLNDDFFQFPAGVKALAGDRNEYGRIFIGSGGVGIAYGELN